MVHLIGVAHEAQASSSGKPESDAQALYADVLKRATVAVRPRVVAEEYNEEAEQENKTRSIGKPIAVALGAEHRFCDPNKAERQQIGYFGPQELHLHIWMHDPNWNISNEEAQAKGWAICIGRYFAVRERFWLEKIRDALDQELVFVLGDGHVDTFTKLLADEGVNSQLVQRGIGVTAENARAMENGLRYLQEHPDCVNEQLF
ncbi:MAG: hypothetical protein ABSG11_24685 [Candidatus Korobacteraceae bacterium]|jgi:hypothetical protein